MYLPRFQKDQVLTADALNKLVDAIESRMNFSPGEGIELHNTKSGVTIGLKPSGKRWIGIVVETGPEENEDDYTDCRYWVSRARVNNDELNDAFQPVAIVEYAPEHVYSKVITATNLNELLNNTHTIQIGTPVEIIELTDIGNPPTTRYVFYGGGGGSNSIWVKITGSSPISGRTNAFVYSWVEVELDIDARWVDKPEGRSSGSTGLIAYNSCENANSESGWQGNSVNIADIPTGWFQPVQGTPVVRGEFIIDCNGDLKLIFQYENGISGQCTEGGG